MNMKTNICESLLRRSFENQLSTYRHNKHEDEILQQTFSLYAKQIRVIGRNIHMNERRFEQHARKDLGLIISYNVKPLEASKDHSFYYRSTNKNWTTKQYSVESSHNALQHKNLYEVAFERRSQQYVERLKQKTHLERLRKDEFMNETECLIRDDDERKNDWPLSENARVKLPLIPQQQQRQQKQFLDVLKIYFPIEI